MGLASTAAKLLASLELDTRPFEAGARRAGAAIGGMEQRFSRIGGIAKQGLATAATNITRIGVVAGGFLALQVRQGIQSLLDLERVTNATAAVIESTGGVAGQTAEEIRALSQRLEELTTADDKAIQSGANMLLTFTNIGEKTFPRATEAVVDLAIAMAEGDVENANFSQTAIQVGKALNDPIRGITALRRVGVAFTTQQEKMIKRLVEAGKVEKAQAIILRELEKEFGKAGDAAGQGAGADMRRFQDAVEDAQQALATGFLPIMSRVATALKTELAKPETIKTIRELGDGLADAFDQVLEVGGRIPWAQIGDAFKLMGTGAKALLTAFTSLPPWVQTAVLTGWGLNKLSGGALSKIGIELLAGKGGLFSRGGTPATPMFTKEVGLGGGGGVPVAGGAKGGLSTLSKVFLVGEAIGLAVLVKEVADNVTTAAHTQATEIGDTLKQSLAGPQTTAQLQQKLAGINQGIQGIQNLGNIPAGIFHETLVELERQREEVVAALEAQAKQEHKNLQPLPDDISKKQQKHFDRLRERTEANRIAIKSLETTTAQKSEAIRAAEQAVRDRVESNRIATQTGLANVRTAQQIAADQIVAAIRALDLIVNVGVSVSGGGQYQANHLTSNKPKQFG